MILRRLISFFVVLFVLCMYAVPVLAQEPGPQVTFTQSWQGRTRIPGWVEVEFILKNEQTDWNGTITVADKTNTITYKSLVDLPQQSRKAIRLVFFSTNGADLTFSIENIGNQRADTKLPLAALNANRVCAYIGSSSLPLPEKPANCGTFLHLQTLIELPETPMVWDSVDVLIINGEKTSSLSAEQSTAMLAWVAAGGHLVISGGLTLGLSTEHLPPLLKIADPGSVTIYNSLPEIGSGQNAIAVSQLNPTPEAYPLLEIAGITMAARKNIGNGLVDILGWDVTHVKSTSWLENLWDSDPVPATAIRVFGPEVTSADIGPQVYALQQIPRDHSPQVWSWLIVFIIYVLLIGPATIIIIRRLNKPILACVLLPGWIGLALVIMSLLLSTTYGMTFPLIHDIAFISMYGENLPARVIQGTALSAPQSKTITWSTAADIRPLWGQFAMDTWSYEGAAYPFTVIAQPGQSQFDTGKPIGMITWGAEGIIPGVSFEADLTLSSNNKNPTIAGSIYSTYALQSVSLIWFGDSEKTLLLADHMAANETTPISVTLMAKPEYTAIIDSLCNASSNPFRMPVAKPILTPDLLQPGIGPECYIIGKTDSVPFPTSDIAGAYTGESCVIYTIPCPRQIPGTFITELEGVTNDNQQGWIDTEMDTVSPGPGASSYTFRLPTHINITQVDAVFISISAVYEQESKLLLENNVIILSLWDWQQNMWVAQSLGTGNADGAYEITLMNSEAQRFFDVQHGNLQLQLISPENSYPQFLLPVRIEGIW